MKKLDPIITDIKELCDPVSIFLYGSRGRTDFLVDSDYEIGVLIPRNRYIGVIRIRESIPLADEVHVFPFELEDFLAGIIDTPFQKSIYLRELALSATTLAGENIVENLIPPPIKVIDLIQEVRFNLGYALVPFQRTE
jgi:predicted nucleotidyltransferase